MSIANLIPALKGTGSRRAVDEVERLRDENRKLLDRQLAADDYFALLMHDVVTTNAALEQEQQLRGEAEETAAQMRMERDEWCEEAERLAAELAPYKAAEANAHPITVPPMHRDTDDPADQATTPIDVRPLWVALGIGPTGAVTDPGHVPASPAEPEPAT